MLCFNILDPIILTQWNIQIIGYYENIQTCSIFYNSWNLQAYVFRVAFLLVFFPRSTCIKIFYLDSTCVCSSFTISRRALSTASSFPVTKMVRLWSLHELISIWAPVFCIISVQILDCSPCSPNRWLFTSLYFRSSTGTWNT